MSFVDNNSFVKHIKHLKYTEKGILPLLEHPCGEKQPATMLAIKTSAGVAPEVNYREHTSYTLLRSANKAALTDFQIH